MTETSILDGWLVALERRRVTLLLTSLAGGLTGISAIAILRLVSHSSAASSLSDQLWYGIPVAIGFWLIVRWNVRSSIASTIAIVGGLVILAIWFISRPEPIVIGDMILHPTSALDTFAVSGVLIVQMGLSDCLVLAPKSEQILIMVWLVIWPFEALLDAKLPGFSETKLQAAMITTIILLALSLLWTIIIDVVILSISELTPKIPHSKPLVELRESS